MFRLSSFSQWAIVLLATLSFGLRGSGADERWLRVATPEFVVITPLREEGALAWTNEFAQFVAALRKFTHSEPHGLPPLTFVVFAREKAFEAYRPLGLDGKAEQVAGFFNRRESWAVAGAYGTIFPSAMRQTIFHEGVHWFLSGTEPANPVWLEEGLAEVFSTFEVRQGDAFWGRSIERHVKLLRGGMLPLERLLFTGRNELFGADKKQTGLVYAQSWAFAHYLVFGRHELPPQALADYAALSLTMIGPDEAFRRAFGKTYGEMDVELKRYVGGGTFANRRDKLVEFAAPEIAEAKRFEVEIALGKLALAGRRWNLAADHARATIQAVPDDARGHELLGLALKEQADLPGAVAALTRAEELGSKDAQIYFELAVAEHNDGATATGEILPLAPAATRRVIDRYRRAIALRPNLCVAYENIAGVLSVSDQTSPDDRQLLEAGLKRWPRNGTIEVGLASLTRRAGDTAAARAQLEGVLARKNGEDAPARAAARRLLDGWEQQDFFERLNGLIAAEKFGEAVALADGKLAEGATSAVRSQLVQMLPVLREGALGKQIEAALKQSRWVEARRLIAEVLAGDGSASMKTQARRALENLDLQRLGLEESRK